MGFSNGIHLGSAKTEQESRENAKSPTDISTKSDTVHAHIEGDLALRMYMYVGMSQLKIEENLSDPWVKTVNHDTEKGRILYASDAHIER